MKKESVKHGSGKVLDAKTPSDDDLSQHWGRPKGRARAARRATRAK